MNRRSVFSFLAVLLCLPAYGVRGDELAETLRFIDEVTGGFLEAPGIASDMEIHVDGTIARTVVTQYFLNDSEQWREGIYQFPLPDDAAVDTLTMMIGDRRVIGFVAEKAAAKKVYETAKAKGQAAGLVDQRRTNLFKTSLANIPPRSLVAIEIQYQSEAQLDEQRFSLRVPLAMTPRYQRMDEEQLRHLTASAGQRWAEPVIDQLALADFDGGRNPVNLTVKLRPGLPIDAPESSSHAIDARRLGDADPSGERYEIALADGVKPGARDFTLEWTPKPKAEPFEALYSERREDGYYSHFLMMAPALDGTTQGSLAGLRPKRQVTYVIDVSGSMDGPSIRQAKRALVLALDDLGDDDLFNIIAFNDDYWKVFPKPAQADSRGIGAAKAAIDRLAAGGGTEMMPALIEALTEPEAEDRLRQIVIITDGAIGYEDQLAATIKKLAGDARFFAIGIGAAPNAHLMRYIAMAGRGSYTFIDDVNAVERELSTLFRKMSTPVLTDLELVLPEGLDAEMLPKALPDLLSGEPISIAIKSAQPLTTFRIEGRRGDQGWRRTVAIEEPRSAEGIGKIFARRKIQALRFDNLGAEDQEAREEITRLAIRHQMISDYTSLVAVDEAILRPMSEPLLQKRHEPTLPLGWQEDRLKALEAEALYRRLQEEPSANGADAPTNQLLQPISLPQTAAGFQLYLMIGFLLLLAGGALLFLTQRQRHA